MSKQDIEKRLGFAAQGVKVEMAAPKNAIQLPVNASEYAALVANDALNRTILGDSLYQITNQDRAIRAAGKAAAKSALARHDAWDKAWQNAPNDAARARVEAEAKKAESGMRKYLIDLYILRAARPGVKATFGLRVPELETLYSSLVASGQAITDKPSARKDRALLLKLDAEYSQPTDTVMVALNAAKLYRQLSAGSKATPQGQKFQQRLEIAGGHRFSRPGAKAEMATAQRSGEFDQAKAILRQVASGFDIESLKEQLVSAKDVARIAPKYKELGQKLIDGLNMVVSALKQMKAESMKSARPGAKAKFDREVGRKGNKSAMIARNGAGADASWLAFVVQHHGEGQGESVLGTMRSYSTEARAKAAALRGLETSGLRGGFSRPGAKAKMAARPGVTVGAPDIAYVRGVGQDYGRRASEKGIARLIDDNEALARIRLLKYGVDAMSPLRSKIDKAFDEGWLKGLTQEKIQRAENPTKFKVGDRVLYSIGTSTHVGTVARVLASAKPEPEYLVNFTTLPTGSPRRNVSESSLRKTSAARPGVKAKA